MLEKMNQITAYLTFIIFICTFIFVTIPKARKFISDLLHKHSDEKIQKLQSETNDALDKIKMDLLRIQILLVDSLERKCYLWDKYKKLGGNSYINDYMNDLLEKNNNENTNKNV